MVSGHFAHKKQFHVCTFIWKFIVIRPVKERGGVISSDILKGVWFESSTTYTIIYKLKVYAVVYIVVKCIK